MNTSQPESINSNSYQRQVTSSPKQFLSRIISHQQVAPHCFRLRLESSYIAQNAQPGQFVHILPRSQNLSDPLLRRAFSVLSVQGESFDVLYRVLGSGTELMSRWSEGQKVDLLGPIGQPFFTWPDQDSLKVLLVGGGVGVPPLAMFAARNRHYQTTALIGARTEEDVLCSEDFLQAGASIEVATEDGSAGHHGLVTQILEKYLASDASFHVLSCGPLPMLRAVAALCQEKNIPCQVSLEENMPCGVGICNGCVVPVVGEGDDYSRFRRICVEGPVLWANEIDWN